MWWEDETLRPWGRSSSLGRNVLLYYDGELDAISQTNPILIQDASRRRSRALTFTHATTRLAPVNIREPTYVFIKVLGYHTSERDANVTASVLLQCLEIDDKACKSRTAFGA